MKVILYMTSTPNGMIAAANDDTSWVTETEWFSFSRMIKKHGNMVIGRRTYEVMLKNKEFDKPNIKDVETIVLSKKPLPVHNPKFVSVAKSPLKVLETLRKKRFKTVMVCGGGELNASFMKENLIDEIYLDVEPIMFGRGKRLFAEADFRTKLELIGTKKLSQNEIQLHYKVKRA